MFFFLERKKELKPQPSVETCPFPCLAFNMHLHVLSPIPPHQNGRKYEMNEYKSHIRKRYIWFLIRCIKFLCIHGVANAFLCLLSRSPKVGRPDVKSQIRKKETHGVLV
jgi:hypothetical protein